MTATRAENSTGVGYAVAAALTPMIAAMSLGFTSPALDTMSGRGFAKGVVVPPHLLIFTGKVADLSSWFSSLVNIGALTGALLGSTICTLLGQRGGLQLAIILVGIPWGVMAWSSSAVTLCCMRVFAGLGVGLQSVASPMFIAEVSPPHLRGTLGTLNAASILLGVTVIDIVGGSIFRNGQFCAWRSLSTFISACSAAQLVITLMLPEPRRPACCKRRYSCGGDLSPAAVSAPLPSPSTGSIAEETPVECSAKTVGLALAGLIPMVWQQLSGFNRIIFFGQSILAAAGVRDYNLLGTSVFVVQLFGIALAASLIECVGRRPLLLVSSGGMMVGSAALAMLLRMASPPSLAVVFVLYAYVISFAIGLGPVPWLLLPELGLPRRLRARLASFATGANWGCSFAMTGPPLEALDSRFGLSGEFFFFSALCLLGFILMAVLVPETGRRRRHGLERRFTFRAQRSRGFASPRSRVPRETSGSLFAAFRSPPRDSVGSPLASTPE